MVYGAKVILSKSKLMKKQLNIILAAFIVLVAGCSGNNENTISISGAFALYPMTVQWAEVFMEENPEININISAGGAGKGMTDALADMVDLGMFSREPEPEELEKGAWFITVARDAVIPTFSSANPAKTSIIQNGMTQNQLQKLFLNADNAGNKNMNIYTRSDACGAAAMWAKYLGADQEDLQGTAVFGDPGLADAVKNDPKGIGYNNMVYIYDIMTRKNYPGIEPIPIDLNQNGTIDQEEYFYNTIDEIMEAVKNGNYPSPPARNLYFVSNGKPQKEATLIFLHWIMTKGQDYVNKAGYVMLTDEQLIAEMAKL